MFSISKPRPYTLVSDYGHHPTEITATIQAAREKWPEKTVWLIFQPHQHHRTKALFDGFVTALSQVPVEKLILTNIYGVPGRKEAADTVSTRDLVQAIEQTEVLTGELLHIPLMNDIQSYIAEHITGDEVVIVMGAGDIYNLTLTLTGEKGS